MQDFSFNFEFDQEPDDSGNDSILSFLLEAFKEFQRYNSGIMSIINPGAVAKAQAAAKILKNCKGKYGSNILVDIIFDPLFETITVTARAAYLKCLNRNTVIRLFSEADEFDISAFDGIFEINLFFNHAFFRLDR